MTISALFPPERMEPARRRLKKNFGAGLPTGLDRFSSADGLTITCTPDVPNSFAVRAAAIPSATWWGTVGLPGWSRRTFHVQTRRNARYEGIQKGTVGTVIERKSLACAENIGAQELVLEFALRIVFPAQFYECGQTTVTGVQLFWGERKQLSPVRTRMKWCQFLFDHR